MNFILTLLLLVTASQADQIRIVTSKGCFSETRNSTAICSPEKGTTITYNDDAQPKTVSIQNQIIIKKLLPELIKHKLTLEETKLLRIIDSSIGPDHSSITITDDNGTTSFRYSNSLSVDFSLILLKRLKEDHERFKDLKEDDVIAVVKKINKIQAMIARLTHQKTPKQNLTQPTEKP